MGKYNRVKKEKRKMHKEEVNNRQAA